MTKERRFVERPSIFFFQGLSTWVLSPRKKANFGKVYKVKVVGPSPDWAFYCTSWDFLEPKQVSLDPP
jgi:hypothetical protein